MIRGSSNEGIDRGLGLGPHLVGKQIDMHGRSLEICEQLGEGGFSFVYLVRNRIFGNDNGDGIECVAAPTTLPQQSAEGHQHSMMVAERQRQTSSPRPGTQMVLKITSVHNISQRQMAEKEARLLQTLSHPSIIQVYDHGFRELQSDGENSSNTENTSHIPNINNASSIHGVSIGGHTMSSSKVAQHLILMEYCEGGTAFDAIKRMKLASPSLALTPMTNSNFSHRFDLLSLVISFGQICNAVSYLHAQRPPIIHRDLKPVNFLIKNGAYKLCDFGSAVIGHTDLRTPENRRKAEEVVNKTTTQMFRAPEMVDLYMAKRLTQSTDVWALGCCLYSLAFLRDCFEEGSNLAILSRKYKIPDDNPYGDGLADLIDRMLARDYRERADMSEVIMCLSALYSNRPLPRRKRAGKSGGAEGKVELKTGTYKTDGQGIRLKAPAKEKKKVVEAKKLNPNSAAAKRKKASERQRKKNDLPPSPPGQADGFQNFASFDRAFEGNFDQFHGHFEGSGDAKADDGAFPSAFDERCRISVASPPKSGADDRSNFVEGYEI